jgi:hypothetical protein
MSAQPEREFAEFAEIPDGPVTITIKRDRLRRLLRVRFGRDVRIIEPWKDAR